MEKVTVLLADDNAAMRESLCGLLESYDQFEIVGKARDGREAVMLAMKLRPDVILIDISMPVLNGFEATEQILASNREAKVVMLSAHDNIEYVDRAIELGAVGFLTKQTASATLSKAICEVANGNRFFGLDIAKRLAAR